jgi:hypothetical protein
MLTSIFKLFLQLKPLLNIFFSINSKTLFLMKGAFILKNTSLSKIRDEDHSMCALILFHKYVL